MSEMELLRDLLIEGLDDWVSINHLIWAADQFPAGRSRRDRVADLLHFVLSEELMEVGELAESGFLAWTGDVDERVRRVTADLDRLGWEPNLGSVAWLTNTHMGDRLGRELVSADGFD